MNQLSILRIRVVTAGKRTLALAFATSLLLSGIMEASTINYTSQYAGNTVPATSGGTIADPSWAAIVSSGSEASSSNGVLFGSTMNAVDTNTQFWLLGEHDDSSTYGTYQAWSVNTTVGFTVDFRVQILDVTGSAPDKAGGFMIQVSDGTRVGSYYFGTDTIYYFGASQYQTTMPLSLTGGLTTFRIAGQNGSYSLYMEGMETPLFGDLLGGSLPGYNRLVWGDFDQAVSGSYNLDFLAWNNQVSEFSAPIPEPTTAMLLIGGIGAGLVALRKGR